MQTVAWDQRFGRSFFFKAAYLNRSGSRAYILNPDPTRGLLSLSSTGESKYWEFEATGRYLASEHRDITVSYVRSHSTRDLNDYDQFFGNFRNPIVRANAYSLSPTDVPNRLIVRGSIGLPGKWVFSPVYEWRTGLPVVDGGRIPGLRRHAQRVGTAPDAVLARLHARPADSLQEVPLHRRDQDLQRLRLRERARRPDQHRVARLRLVLQPDSALDWVRHLIGPVGLQDLADVPRTSEADDRQKARTVCTIGTQPVIPAVYGVKAPL